MNSTERETIRRLSYLGARLDEAEADTSRRAIWNEVARLAQAAAGSLSPAVKSVTIRLPGDPVAALSPNLRTYWRRRAAAVKEWRGRARLAWIEAGRPRFECVRLDIVVYRSRASDLDNCLASCKGLIDGFCDYEGEPAMLPDDSPRHVLSISINQVTGRQYKDRPEVIITVIPVEGPDHLKELFA